MVKQKKESGAVVKYKKENQEANLIASKVMHKVLVKLNIDNGNNYLNVSVDNHYVGYALIALKVMRQPNKLGLSRLPGSNPGQGVSTFFNNSLGMIKKW